MRLTLRRTWSDEPGYKPDYVILGDGRQIGRMYKYTSLENDLRWFWTVYCVPGSPRGVEPTREVARAQVLAALAR
jgi:hypothetical protein